MFNLRGPRQVELSRPDEAKLVVLSEVEHNLINNHGHR